MSAIDDFWNEVGAAQMAAGGAPSVRTKEIKDYEAGERELKDVLPEGVTMEDTLETVAKVQGKKVDKALESKKDPLAQRTYDRLRI